MRNRYYFGVNQYDNEKRNEWLDEQRELLEIALVWEWLNTSKKYGYHDRYVMAVLDASNMVKDGRRNSFSLEELKDTISLLQTATNVEDKLNFYLSNELIDYMYSLVKHLIRLNEHDQGMKNLLSRTNWVFTKNLNNELTKEFDTEIRKIYIPILEPMNRYREYDNFDSNTRAKILYEYLFNSRTYSWLDKNLISLNTTNEHDYHARGVLLHIGIKLKHQGIFEKLSIKEAICLLEHKTNDYRVVIESLRLLAESNDIIETIQSDIESEMIEDGNYYTEGAAKKFYGKRYERNAINRRKAIEIHGTTCLVCGFNFENVYGDRGKDFIEIHHLRPLSTVREEVVIDPQTDLAPVCANCHRMIHRNKDNILSIEQLKNMLKQPLY